MHKIDLALNNLKRLICNKTKPNQPSCEREGVVPKNMMNWNLLIVCKQMKNLLIQNFYLRILEILDWI